MHVLISGAGIAGATAAIALREKGFAVTLLERAETLRSVGSGLQIQPCASRVVEALNLSEELAAIGSVPDKIDFVEARTGRLIIRGVPRNKERQFPHYQVHRADFHAMLIERAVALGAQLELGAAVDTVESSATGATAHLADGRRISADVLIGADGVHSAVRHSLFGKEKAQFTGHIAYRAMVDAANIKHKVKAGVVLGPNAHFVIYPLRGGRWVNVVAQMEAAQWLEESWTSNASVDDLRKVYAGWHRDIDSLLEAMSETFKWGLFTRPPMASWSKGRVGLIGDACHPSLPNLGAGAAMAMEDAYLLAELLAKHGHNIDYALEQLYALRIQRCTRVQQVSAGNARMFHLSNPLQRKFTYRALSLVSNLAPSVVQSQLAWLQNYDITALQI